MRFVDEAKIRAIAGKGGAGMVAWRREKFVPMGGPAGGNGGKGGDIIFVAKEGMSTLLDLKRQTILKAHSGKKGQSKNKSGRNGEDLVVHVPVGTLIKIDDQGSKIFADLTHDNQRVTLCRGGQGGFGNSHFKCALNNAPEHATDGEKGEEKDVTLTLKLMADVGFLGFPNAGKSTLLTKLSNAKPKIASYPFTTIKPMVGVCEIDYGQSMVLADIPGLIEGASLGAGLGFRFLRHLERVRLLCHIIDGSDPEDPTKKYQAIENELRNYSEKLFALPRVIVLNKIDAIDDERAKNVGKFLKEMQEKNIEIFQISALQEKGLNSLKHALYQKVKNNREINCEQPVVKKQFDPTENLYY